MRKVEYGDPTTFLICPLCLGIERKKVIDSRGSLARDAIRRRRECEECGGRFTTYETVENVASRGEFLGSGI